MYKHELYKIFTKKSLYLVFFLIVLLLVYANQDWTLDWVMKEQIYEDLFHTYGGPVTDELEKEVREQMLASDAGEGDSASKAESNVQFLVAKSALNLDELTEQKGILSQQMTTFDHDSYQYRQANKEYQMLENLGNPFGYYRIQSWIGMMDLIEPFFSVVLISLMLLLGLSPVFSEDQMQKTDGLILATKHGRKQLVTAKLLASATYITVIFVSLHFANFMIQLNGYGGLVGWDAPMQSLLTFPANYAMSPFSWDVWQFFAVMLSVQFLASLAFGVLILFLSHLTKNVLMTFFISGSILGLPFVLRQIGFDRGFFETFNLFSYLEFIRIERLFDQFRVFNFFGQPVLYSTYLIGVFSLISLLLLGGLYYHSKHQQVKN